MEKVREINRLYHCCGLKQRAIARALGVSRPVVKTYIDKIQSAGLDYAEVEKMEDDCIFRRNLPLIPA